MDCYCCIRATLLFLYLQDRIRHMTLVEDGRLKEKPFEGMKIYFSSSIRGVPNPEPDFAWHIVQTMLKGGANVLSEHVGARNRKEMDDIFARKSGIDRRTLDQPWFEARRIDMQWVDEATHLVAVVNGPSHGVGMELERAILKPERGLNSTPILCLIQENLLKEGLTWMIRGVSRDECPVFELLTYTDLKDAREKVTNFLFKNK
jgi:hypothetical protein